MLRLVITCSSSEIENQIKLTDFNLDFLILRCVRYAIVEMYSFFESTLKTT